MKISAYALGVLLISLPALANEHTTNPNKKVEMPQSAPVQQAPIQQEAPVQQAPVQQAPVQQAPVQQAPVQQAPVQQAPVQQAPVQQAPVQQAAPVQQQQQQMPRILIIRTKKIEQGKEKQEAEPVAIPLQNFPNIVNTESAAKKAIQAAQNVQQIQINPEQSQPLPAELENLVRNQELIATEPVGQDEVEDSRNRWRFGFGGNVGPFFFGYGHRGYWGNWGARYYWPNYGYYWGNRYYPYTYSYYYPYGGYNHYYYYNPYYRW